MKDSTRAMYDAIAWQLMVKPQDDHYDSAILKFLHPQSQRLQRIDNPAIALAEGAISVEQRPAWIGGVEDATPEQIREQIVSGKIDGYLRHWSAGYTALRAFIDVLYPLTGPEGAGCTSGHVWRPDEPRHCIYVSINDAHGCAQGIYHEMAHLRLYVMGIEMEDHDYRLLLNAPDELYKSSVRFDKLRPMTAVLHGVYAWLMFTENDLQLFEQGVIDRQEFLTYAGRNIGKIQAGMDEIRKHARWTDEGNEFFQGLQQWSDAIMKRIDTTFHGVIL